MTSESKLYQNPAKKLARTKGQKHKREKSRYMVVYSETQGKRKHKEKREKKPQSRINLKVIGEVRTRNHGHIVK